MNALSISVAPSLSRIRRPQFRSASHPPKGLQYRRERQWATSKERKKTASLIKLSREVEKILVV